MSVTNASFPKETRLKRSVEFLEVFKKGCSVRNAGIALHFQKNKTPNKSRVGIVVSRKAMPRAVDRNHAKRIVREFFRTENAGLKQGYDVVIKFEIQPKPFIRKDLQETLKGLFARANLYL